MNRTDVIIIGGGVAGLMSARELAGAGLRVALLERQAVGRESSWAGGGILSPLHPWQVAGPVTALCQWSQAAYPPLAEALRARTGVDPEWLPSGLLFLDCGETGAATRWAEAHAVRYERPGPAELAGLEPGLSASVGEALLLPGVGQVRNPRLLRALRRDLELCGVELLEHRPVEEILLDRGKVKGLALGRETLEADAYVVAAGAWSGLLAGNSGLMAPPVAPVKGEMLVFDAPPGLLAHIVLCQGRYLIPRKDGKILVGSTVENAQFDKSASAASREALRDFACGLLPALRPCRIEKHWAGLRPGSPSGIPFIGPHPEADNLYFNCGHFRNGLVTAPASARLLADLILGRPPILPPEPYSLQGRN
jgi:glycine oxidase